MVQVEPNKYLSYVSILSEGSLGRLEESETSRRYTTCISTRFQKIKRKFHKCIECFLVEGGSCFYDDETIGNIEVSLMYKHLVKQWVPNVFP